MSLLGMVGSAFWVVGLAVMCTTLGWRLWESRFLHKRLTRAPIWFGVSLGALIYFAGLSLAASQASLRILCAFLAGVVAITSSLDAYSRHQEKH